jgi:hypothetical protein
MVVDIDAMKVGEDAVVPELVGEVVAGALSPDEGGEEGLVVDVDDDGDPDWGAGRCGGHLSLG